MEKGKEGDSNKSLNFTYYYFRPQTLTFVIFTFELLFFIKNTYMTKNNTILRMKIDPKNANLMMKMTKKIQIRRRRRKRQKLNKNATSQDENNKKKLNVRL